MHSEDLPQTSSPLLNPTAYQTTFNGHLSPLFANITASLKKQICLTENTNQNM